MRGSLQKVHRVNCTRCSRLVGSSEEERREDALAPGAEEGRDKLRKAAVRSKYPMNRRCPNGGTRLRKAQSLYDESIVI